MADSALAILPLIISSTKRYENCLRPIQEYIHFSKPFGDFQQKFERQRIIFQNQCQLLLEEAVDPNVAAGMLRDGAHMSWTDEGLDHRLSIQLGMSRNACTGIICKAEDIAKRLEEWSTTLAKAMEQAQKSTKLESEVSKSLFEKIVECSSAKGEFEDVLFQLKELNESFLILAPQTLKLKEHYKAKRSHLPIRVLELPVSLGVSTTVVGALPDHAVETSRSDHGRGNGTRGHVDSNPIAHELPLTIPVESFELAVTTQMRLIDRIELPVRSNLNFKSSNVDVCGTGEGPSEEPGNRAAKAYAKVKDEIFELGDYEEPDTAEENVPNATLDRSLWTDWATRMLFRLRSMDKGWNYISTYLEKSPDECRNYFEKNLISWSENLLGTHQGQPEDILSTLLKVHLKRHGFAGWPSPSRSRPDLMMDAYLAYKALGGSKRLTPAMLGPGSASEDADDVHWLIDHHMEPAKTLTKPDSAFFDFSSDSLQRNLAKSVPPFDLSSDIDEASSMGFLGPDSPRIGISANMLAYFENPEQPPPTLEPFGSFAALSRHVPYDEHYPIAKTDASVECSCGKKFHGQRKAAKSNLKRHMFEINNRQAYSCPRCGKSFSRSDNRKTHIETCRAKNGTYSQDAAADKSELAA